MSNSAIIERCSSHIAHNDERRPICGLKQKLKPGELCRECCRRTPFLPGELNGGNVKSWRFVFVENRPENAVKIYWQNEFFAVGEKLDHYYVEES